MDSRSRVLTTLEHKEPDRVPFDLAGATNAGIHVIAYQSLLEHWGDPRRAKVEAIISQKAVVHEDILDRLKVDSRKANPSTKITERLQHKVKSDKQHTYFRDSWGIKWAKPKKGGLYYDIRENPLSSKFSKADIDDLTPPSLYAKDQLADFRERAKVYRDKGFAIIVGGTGGGIFEWACWLRGYKNFFVDMLARKSLAERLLRKILEHKLRHYRQVLNELGDLVDIVAEGDDMATQERLMISPDLYRRMIKPLHIELFKEIQMYAGKRIYIHFHSCGAIRELIPELIEAGIDALNPVQVSARGMDTKQLKKDFGRDITFWGGGVDTQHTLPKGTPEQVRAEVKRRIDDLAPGGGFVFSAVHNIQPDVPAENIIAMWESLKKHGSYQ